MFYLVPDRLRCAVILLSLGLILTACGNDAEQAAEHLRKAEAFMARNNSSSAIIELKNALQISPDDAKARNILGQIYLNSGLGADALKELQRARELGTKDPEIPHSITRAMLMVGQFTEALAEIKASGKEDAEWKILEGKAHLGLDDMDQARTAYNQALEINPSFPAAQRGLARIAMLTGDHSAAQSFISKALDSGEQEIQTLLLKAELEFSLQNYLESEQTFLKILELSKGLPVAHLGAARALLAQEKLEDAQTHLDALETAKVSSPQVFYLKALLAQLKNNPDQAIAALRDVLKVLPEHVQSLLLLGQIHYQRRELDQAQSRLEQVVANQPSSIAGRKLLAAVYLELNQSDKAILTLAPVEKALPDDPQTLSLLGTAYMQQGKFEQGKEYLNKAKNQSPKTAAIQTQLAISHLATGKTDAAIKELEEAIAQDPEFERADYLVILTHLRGGNTSAAFAAVNNLIDKDPENPIAHNLRGAVHEVDKDYDKARSAYLKVLELEPKSKAGMLNLARLDMRDKNPDAAKLQLEAILKEHPNDTMALMGLARIASDQGQGEKGIEYLKQAREQNSQALQPRLVLGNYYLRKGDLDEALKLATETQNLAPDNPASLLLSGRTQLAKGQFNDARKILSTLVKIAPNAAMAHFYLAIAQQRGGATDAARTELQTALELEPDNAQVMVALGQLENRAGNTEAAETIAEQLALAHPKLATAEELRGDISARSQQWDSAISHYNAAFERNQNSSLVAKIFAARRRAGQLVEARSWLTQWLDKHPDDIAIQSLLASVDQQDGKQDSALSNYESIIKRSPKHVIALNNLAWLYYERKDKRALEYAKRAYDVLPERAEIIDTYGWMLLENGQIERGLRLLEKAVTGAPDNGDIRFHRAAALSRAGDNDQAKSELERLLAQDQEFSERKKAQALFEQLTSE